MLTPQEKQVFRQVCELKRAINHGDLAAIGVKECLRNHFETERIEWEKMADEMGVAALTAIVPRWELVCTKLAFGAHVLDGWKPESLQWHREWTPVARKLLVRLQKLENRPPILANNELSYYLLWTIMQAVILVDATELLEQWHSNSSELERLRRRTRELQEEAKRYRLRAKGIGS